MKSRLRLPAVLAAVVLVASACGDDSSTIVGAGDNSLVAPTPIQIAGGVDAGTAAGSRAEMAAADSASLDMIAPAFLIDFVLGDVGSLPTHNVGYRFPGDQSAPADRVATLAEALGVDGEPVAGNPDLGYQWQVGPNDGSAPSLIVNHDPLLSWWYNAPWGEDRAVVACAEPLDTGDETGDETTVEPCPEPEPPAGILSAAEAEARSRDLLSAMGLDPDDVTLTTWADDWFASVQAEIPLPGFDAPAGSFSPLAYSFGFGAEGVLQYASGSFARPQQVGPFPLVDLDTAFARLVDQGGFWGGFGGPAVDVMVAESAPVGAPTPAVESESMVVEGSDGASAELLPPVGEPEVRTVTLVDVVADLWWAGDEDGSQWLLPSYRFIGDDGGWYTVPAVSDEYLILPPGPATDEGRGEGGTDPEGAGDGGAPEEVSGGGSTEPDAEEPSAEGDTSEGDGGMAEEPDETTPTDEAGDLTLPDELIGAVGSSLEDFETLANKLGYSVRPSTIDGEPQALTMDYNPQRINVSITGGVVVGIDSLG